MTGVVLKPDSLAFSLTAAAQAITLVRGGTALPQALATVFAHGAGTTAARGAIQDIAYRSMRQLGLTQALLDLLTERAPPLPVHSLLSCALALMCAPADALPYEDFTVVDQAVTAAAADPATARAKGMVNAVLRRFLRERDALLQQARTSPPARWNYPQWWIDAARTAWPRDWQQILEAGNSAAPLTLRVNRRRGSVADYLQLLTAHALAASQIGPDAVRLQRPLPVAQIPGFEAGLVSVQDAAAQLAAPLLELHDGMRVLDACAAPGGKSGHLLECAQIDLLALDSDATRLTRIDDNLRRLGLTATLKQGDATRDDWWDGVPFDCILADVPCTASGIVRRHPDIRWLRRKSDSAQLATLAARILDNLWRMLAPNGKLLFVTCSLWPQESEAQAAAFAMRHQARRLDAPG
ncbi:MAG TPA: 16S rRNA (cytosine(967)-C(5))-methyltransferase RsmB, partial [Burkholderiaceae bacterium]|nr:16S rRNA (cytosine(967)-C(5))-methyltransferase RsmB [Burkholderiaceae bacterium]